MYFVRLIFAQALLSENIEIFAIYGILYYSLVNHTLLLPQRWMYCITSTRRYRCNTSSAAEVGGCGLRDYTILYYTIELESHDQTHKKALIQHFNSPVGCHLLVLVNSMATESSLSDPAASRAEPTSRIATLRSRAFLSDLPDDFLNPSGSSTTAAPRQGGTFG